MTNMDANGIRYTMFSCNNLDSDVLHDLLYGGTAQDLSYLDAVNKEVARQRAEWEEECERRSVAAQDNCTAFETFDDFEPDLDDFDPMIDEPMIEGTTAEGIYWRTTWLGGAQMLWIFRSPLVGHFNLCSPCVPGACDGNSRVSAPGEGFIGYDIPPDWEHRAPDDGQTFAQRMEAE